MEPIQFYLKEEYIPLIQLLKVTNVVYSGSEAQMVVAHGEVKRNDQIELRKRAKIRSGEVIEYAGYIINVL